MYVGTDEDPLQFADLVRKVLEEVLDPETAPPLVGIQDFSYVGAATGIRY